MAGEDLDCLVVADPANMNYLTGYDGWSFYVHQCVVVPPDGEPIFFGRAMDAVGARFTAYIAEDGIIVRRVAGYGLPHCLRITIGTRDEDAADARRFSGPSGVDAP